MTETSGMLKRTLEEAGRELRKNARLADKGRLDGLDNRLDFMAADLSMTCGIMRPHVCSAQKAAALRIASDLVGAAQWVREHRDAPAAVVAGKTEALAQRVETLTRRIKETKE